MKDEQPTGRVFSALGKSRLVRSMPPDDFGFASKEGAKRVQKARAAAAAEANGALIPVIVGRLSTLQNLVDQSVQRVGDERPVCAESVGLLSDYRKGIIAYRAIGRIGCDDVSQHELLQSVDAILQFLELVLIERGHGGESPDGGEPVPSTPTPNSPHRLSEAD